MPLLSAVILGLIEGITEYLPVSSTGHLVLTSHLLHVDEKGAFSIVIQLGAVLAVAVHYRVLLATRLRGLFSASRESVQLAVALALGFLPVATAGFLLHKAIKARLFGPLPVAAALIAGGVLMIVVERVRAARQARGGSTGLVGLEHVTPARGLMIGLAQCVSLWPGSSRSMCTIVAGQLAGLSTATAAEFSFLLALPTLGVATVYEGIKSRHELASGVGSLSVVVGLVVSFGVAWSVVALFLHYLQRRGLEPFGYYRIALGLLVFALVR